MKTVLFLTTHLGSGASGLINILNVNPRIEMFCPQNSYSHPTDLDPLVARPHKLSNTAAIYGEYLWFNAQLSCKSLYTICKFIYVIREAKSSIGELMSTHGYSTKRAALYYAFRLRRICEMAKRTPGAVCLTWNDMESGDGLPLIEQYLRLKIPLEHRPEFFVSKAVDDLPHEIESRSQDCYERHLYFLRNLQLLKTT